ncbi:hypothetical protein [Priestia megaterium]|uniref:hypothetical protein n=1 Tax=Priestia megaterium TaxID=1404 RepID=UPI000BF8BF54|nr:hypothetical protein [Priestia megaterium]PFW43825.1 hypothetical protein COL17_26835 [Priestia megaterium]
MFANYKSEVTKMQEELEEMKELLDRAQREKRDAQFAKSLIARSASQLESKAQFAEREMHRLQKLNDELITKVGELAHKQVEQEKTHKMALTVRDKEIEAQAKYTAELRSYTSSLHEKIRELNGKVNRKREQRDLYICKHHEALKEVQALKEAMEEERQSRLDLASHHLKIENNRLRDRVIELETALDTITDIAEKA